MGSLARAQLGEQLGCGISHDPRPRPLGDLGVGLLVLREGRHIELGQRVHRRLAHVLIGVLEPGGKGGPVLRQDDRKAAHGV